MDAPARDLTAGRTPAWVPHAAATGCLALAVAVVWRLGVVARWTTWSSQLGAIDLERYFYPKFAVGNAAFAAGRMPLWNADELCGMPFLATAQVAALYPLKVIAFGLFDPPTAIRLLPPLHLLLAGVFAYAATHALGTSWGAAMLAGVLTALCPGFLDSFYHPVRIMCLAWTPLAWWCFVRALEARTPRTIALAGIVPAVMFTAGYPLYVLCLGVCLMVPIADCAAGARGTRVRVLGAAATIGAVALGLAAVQLLPLAELTGETSRAALVAEWNAQHVVPAASGLAALPALPLHVLQTLVFVAGPSAGAAIVGIAAPPRRIALRAFAALVVSLAASSVLRPLVELLPGLRHMRAPELIWPMFAPFFVAPLAALGWDRLTDRGRWRWWVPLLLLGGPTLTAIGFWREVGWIPRSVWVAYALAGLAWLAHRRPAWRTRAAVALAAGIVWVAWGSVRDNVYRFNPYPTEVSDPDTRAVLRALAGDGRVFSPMLTWHGTMLLDGIANVQGNEASLRPYRVGRLLDLVGLGGEATEILGQPEWTKLVAARPLLDLLGVAAVVAPTRMRELEGLDFAGPAPFPPWGVAYRNRRYRGRAFALHRVRCVADPEDALGAVVDPGFRVDDTAVIECAAPPPADAVASPSSVTLVSHAPEAIELDANMAAAGVVVLTDAWFPGWEATVDDRPVPLWRADYAFRAVAVPAGTHRVRMTYRPWSFRWGVWISAAMTAASLLAIGRGRRAV